jgi:hypothetical protein
MNPIEQLLFDLGTASYTAARKEVRRVARRKSLQPFRPALNVVAEFLDTLAKQDARRRLPPKTAMRDRQASTPSPKPASPDPLRAFVEKAAAFVSEHSGVPASQIVSNRTARDRAYKAAAKKLHPDKQSGDTALMQQLTAYWRVLKILDEVPQ